MTLTTHPHDAPPTFVIVKITSTLVIVMTMNEIWEASVNLSYPRMTRIG